MLSINQIISRITTLASTHYQIAETGVGDFAEWQAKDRNYPLLWVFHEQSSINERYLVHDIRLICADRVITGEEGDDTEGHEQEVLSDTQLVLLDFLAYFNNQYGQDYDIIRTATIEPFTERFNDRVAGNSVVIQIRQRWEWNKCSIPESGAVIPPTVDGLTLYDFSDPTVFARLTAQQLTDLETLLCSCADATVQLNGVTVGTIASGGTESFTVNLDGVPSGTWNGSAWIIPPCPSVGVVEIGIYSDSGFTNPITSADIGDTIYIRAESVSGITPVEYLFAFVDALGNCTVIYNGATDNTSWLVAGDAGTGRLFCFGTEDASSTEDWVGQSKDFELTGFEGVLDAYPNNNVWAGSQIALRFGFTNPLVRYRRASDNDSGNFSRDNAVTPVRITDDSILSGGVPSSNDGDTLATFVSGTDAFAPTIYDQTTNGNNAIQSTSTAQPKVVSSGSLILGNSRPAFEWDGTNDVVALWNASTPPPAAYQTLGAAITYIDWVYPTDLSGGSFVWFAGRSLIELSSFAVNGNIPLSVGFAGNKLKVGMADNNTSSYDTFLSTATFSINTWYKIAVTVNANTVKIYINGSIDSTHTIVNATGDRSMGNNNATGYYGDRLPSNSPFKGRTLAPILKAEVLSDAEIADIHNNYYV